MNRPFLFPISLLFAILPAGCLPLASGSSSEPASVVAAEPQGDRLAASISQIVPGTTVHMATPLGDDSQVWAGPAYQSGLGIPCRHAVIGVQGVQRRLAVCNGNQGWFVAEPVFDSNL